MFGERKVKGPDGLRFCALPPAILFTVFPVRLGVFIGLRSLSAAVAFILWLRVFAEDFISWSRDLATESAYKQKLRHINLQRRGVAGEVSLSLLVTHDAQRPMARSVPGLLSEHSLDLDLN